MEEICSECNCSTSSSREIVTLTSCLKCHASVCISCQRRHQQKDNSHFFYFTVLRSSRLCTRHRDKHLNTFCDDCYTLTCDICAKDSHHSHAKRPLGLVSKEVRQYMKDKHDKTIKVLNAIYDDLEKGEQVRLSFLKQVELVKEDLIEMRERLSSMFTTKVNDLNWLKYQLRYGLHNEIDEYLLKMQSHIIRKRVNNEVVNFIPHLLLIKDDFDFLSGYLNHRRELDMVVVPGYERQDFQPVGIKYRKPPRELIREKMLNLDFQSAGSNKKKVNECSDTISSKTDLEEIVTLKNVVKKKDEELGEATAIQDWTLRYVSSLLQKSKERKTITRPTFRQDKNSSFVHSFVEVIDKINSNLNEQTELILELKKKDEKTVTSQQKKPNPTKDQEKTMSEEITSLEESIQRTIRENTHLQKSITRSDQEISDFRKSNETLSVECENLKQKLKDTEKDFEGVRTRLSQVAGARLTDGNSGITDLGDVYRPTKIAEMYSQIYDTEWTETMDAITKESSKWTEEQIIKHLCSVLQACYKYCHKFADEQLEEVFQKLVPNAIRSDMSKYVAEAKQIKDARKGLAMIVYPSVKKMFNSHRLSGLKNQTGIDSCLIERICRTNFLDRCVMVCWLMVVQDPVMYIDDELKPGTAFNKEIYREYMKRGNVISFVVWPALFLRKNGPLLLKGVAQPVEHKSS